MKQHAVRRLSTYIHTYIHTYFLLEFTTVYIHTCIHTYIHTYIHTRSDFGMSVVKRASIWKQLVPWLHLL